jgi:hypothetical protein
MIAIPRPDVCRSLQLVFGGVVSAAWAGHSWGRYRCGGPRDLAQLRLHGSARAEKDADLSSFRSYSWPSRFSKVSES